MQGPTDRARWYTKVRRFPHYVGQIGGQPISLFGLIEVPPLPRGQFLTGLVLIVVLVFTRGLWAVGPSLVYNVGLGLIVVIGGTFLAGYFPWGGRSFVWAAWGAVTQWASLTHSRYAGDVLTWSAPQRFAGRVSVFVPTEELAPVSEATALRPAPPEPLPIEPKVSTLTPIVRPLTPVALSLARSAAQQRSAHVA